MLSADTKVAVHGVRAQRGQVRAAYLLLAWLAFWLNSAVFPCGLVLAPNPEPHSSTRTPSSANFQYGAEHSREPLPAGTHCADMSAMCFVAPSSVAPESKDFYAKWLPARVELSPPPHNELALVSAFFVAQHPPQIPQYLRNQRFLN